MARFFVFLMLVVLLGLVGCSEEGGRDGEGKESLLSRSKRSRTSFQNCPCPDLNELRHPKRRSHACPCDGFILGSLSGHRNQRHSHKSKQHRSHKKKCVRFLKHCTFQGMHVPL